MPENKRLKNVIYWLLSQEMIESQEDLADKLELTPAYLSHVVTGVKPLSEKLISKLTGLYDKIDPNYFNDAGDMISVNQRIGRIDNNHGNISGNVAGDVNIGCGERIKELEAEIFKQRNEIESLRQTNQKLLDQMFKLTDRLLDK